MNVDDHNIAIVFNVFTYSPNWNNRGAHLWLNNHDTLCKRLPLLGKGTKTLISSASGSVVLSHARFDAFEGQGTEEPYAVLGMCMAGGGRTMKINKHVKMDDIWRPSKIGLALPSIAAKGFTPSMEMLGIAFN